MQINLTWSELKNVSTLKNLPLQYITKGNFYKVWMQEEGIIYMHDIYIESPTPAGSDQEDFEQNYQSNANKPLNPRDEYGKQFIRAESRPLDMSTYFTCAGDSGSNIGDGKLLCWDFSNSDDDITPSGVTYKRKRLEFSFLDTVRVKEGGIYFQDKLFGSYIDLYIICPNGQYYIDNNEVPQLATEDTSVNHFVNKHMMTGTVNLGDELNTEAASAEIPSTYKFWIEITVPDTDSTSKGHVSLELYRNRTEIL